MSKKESSPENGDQVPDLSSLDFGPAWAKDKPKRTHSSEGRQTGKSGKSSGSGKYGKNKDGRGGSRSGQTHGGDEKRRKFDRKKGRGRRDFNKEGNRKPHVEAPDGITARIMPIEEGMDAMAKQITATGRTHSVFELAWVVLGGLDRFHIIFESGDQQLYRSNSDHSVWLTKQECLSHFWASGLVKKYYDEEITEVDPPTGNFQSVARCGLSGQLIGPPNHHAYQQSVADLHRAKFSNMALDRYKSKIIMEHGEEAVQEWMDSMRKCKRWRPKPLQAEQASAPDEAADVAEENTSTSPEDAEVSEALTSEVAEPDIQEQDAESSPAVSDTPVAEETVVILHNRREVDQHFLAHGFEQEFECANITSALANIPAKMISPGLLTLLKNTVAEEKRYPGKLASILCRQMSGRHLAVFKWKKKLHCGPARPKRVPDDLVMADRPSALFHWVIDHPGGNIDQMWKDLLPSDIDDDGRHTWYHDLHWLINEGLVLLFADGTLHAAKELDQPKKQSNKPVTPKKEQRSEEEKADEQLAGKPDTTTDSSVANPSVEEVKKEEPKSEPQD